MFLVARCRRRVVDLHYFWHSMDAIVRLSLNVPRMTLVNLLLWMTRIPSSYGHQQDMEEDLSTL